MAFKKLQKYTLDLLKQTKSYQELVQTKMESGRTVELQGLCCSSLPYVLGEFSSDVKAPICIIAGNAERSEEIFDDFSFFGINNVFHFPKWEMLPYENEEPVLEISAKRFDTYNFLLNAKNNSIKPSIIVSSIEALFQKVIPLDALKEYVITLNFGDQVNNEKLAEKLVSAGYERVQSVESRGEFSIRGGIIDIYPINHDLPIRIDLFGNEVEEIRYFDAYTQRRDPSREPLEKAEILPFRENQILESLIVSGAKLAILSEMLPEGTIIILDEPDRFEMYDESFQAIVDRQYAEMRKEDPYIEESRFSHSHAPDLLYAKLTEVLNSFKSFPQIHHNILPIETVQPDEKTHPIRFRVDSFEMLKPSLDAYVNLMRKRQGEDYVIVIVCDNEGQVMRLDEILRDNEISAIQIKEGQQSDNFIERAHIEGYQDIVLTVGMLHGGFAIKDANVMFITDREIFGRYKKRRVYKKIYKGAEKVKSIDEINRGDYVVHIEHGIGQFLGIRQQTIDARTEDLIELEYKDGDKLLVPVHKIKYIQKYSAVEGVKPDLDKLGSKKWQQRRTATQEKIEEMAEELLALYAKRTLAQGYVYSPDTIWQKEFEASFIYQETPDQLRAIDEVKNDMMAEKPMDRLVCGDVGYGKTEVAIRAAFKVVQDKKQVAILVPTTLLAQQHYATFSERFAEYPIKVDVLSRFKSAKQQDEILKKVEAGEINVIVGTHRLLSKDVKFKDLGMVVVDEEQRFGVKHKEKLKEMRTTIDYMTLTATPIPRTLYMSLAGLRDLSIINTPPADRHPIKTKIINFNRDQIEEAILREMNRGGQIYFVHNRVHNIAEVAQTLKEIVPHAKLAIAHGQMDEHQLEKIMLDFIDGKYDILISTTIIESGIDIPNVNTIIINRADAFGLAQLYQLRGRVGRDVRRAYAYLIVPHGRAITSSAVKRLAAIEEFTELGVGFNIAMRDMEIRGTGNILGKEQHGCISSIGFELYCQMLEETVRKLKGEIEEQEPGDVEIKWNCDCFIPQSYIPVESQRIAFYKRLSRIRSLEDIKEIRDEVMDRFGDIPEPVSNLFYISSLRIFASQANITNIRVLKNGFKVFCQDGSLEIIKSIGSKLPKTEKIDDIRVVENDFVEFTIDNWQKNLQKLQAAARIMRHIAKSKLATD